MAFRNCSRGRSQDCTRGADVKGRTNRIRAKHVIKPKKLFRTTRQASVIVQSEVLDELSKEQLIGALKETLEQARAT